MSKCKCLNKDGTLSDICNGICSLDIIDHVEEQARDPLNGFAELILSQVEKRIDQRLAKFRIDIHDEFIADYKKSLLEGIREGIKIAKDINDDHECLVLL